MTRLHSQLFFPLTEQVYPHDRTIIEAYDVRSNGGIIVMAILDGKARAAKLRKDIKADAQRFQDKHGRPPGLDVIVVGDDPASAVYVKGKEKACTKVGFRSKVHRFPNDASEQEIILAIKELNHDETVDGILLQLPLPKPLRASKIIDFIDPLKDVDGLHPSNLGKLLTGQKGIVP